MWCSFLSGIPAVHGREDVKILGRFRSTTNDHREDPIWEKAICEAMKRDVKEKIATRVTSPTGYNLGWPAKFFMLIDIRERFQPLRIIEEGSRIDLLDGIAPGYLQ
jgi:hypothetical protein